MRATISFAVHLLVARLLGAESYGYFVYATRWMAILLLGCNIGLKPTVVRFVAAYKARGEWGSLCALLRCSTAWTIGASAVVTIVSGVALWILRPGFDELDTTLALMALAMPFMALADVWSSTVRGLGAVACSQYPASIVQHVLMCIALVIIVLSVGENGEAVTAAAAFLVATIGAVVMASFCCDANCLGKCRHRSPVFRAARFSQLAANFLYSNLKLRIAPAHCRHLRRLR